MPKQPQPASLATKVAFAMEDDVPWPDKAELFTPYEMEQMTVPDLANCLAVRALLHAWNLSYSIVMRWNAEWMSPTGRVPFLKCGKFLLTDLETIAEHCKKRRLVPAEASIEPDSPEMCEMRTYMSLINNIFYHAELYVCWVDENTYKNVTSLKYGYVFPWPLNVWQNFTKKWKVTSYLDSFKWYSISLEEVLEKLDQCCNSLTERLGDNTYFYGKFPTELDALVFGHIFTIITTKLPGNHLANVVQKYPKLVEHTNRIDDLYFKKK